MYLSIFLIIILILEFIYYIITMNSKKDNSNDYYRDIPSNENPAIIGYLTKENVDGNDIMATILDLWKKGYIDVRYEYVNDKEQCILYETEKQRFMILKDYENYLLDELFRNGKRMILDDYISSDRFEATFKGIGNMIKKRIDIKTKHKISFKRLLNKINFLVVYLVLGFSLFFSILYPIINNFYISILLGYVLSISLFLFIKNILIKKKELEQLLFSYSIAMSILLIGIIIGLYLLDNNVYKDNIIFNIFNIITSIILLINIFLSNNKKWRSLNYIDYIIIIYSLISIIFMNSIGLCLCIIYISHKIYINSPNHIYYSNDEELRKWLGLKNFLNDFSIINERESEEIKIWNDYLIYAIAMGVNKKCIMEYAKLSNIKLINQSFLEKHYLENFDY